MLPRLLRLSGLVFLICSPIFRAMRPGPLRKQQENPPRSYTKLSRQDSQDVSLLCACFLNFFFVLFCFFATSLCVYKYNPLFTVKSVKMSKK